MSTLSSTPLSSTGALRLFHENVLWTKHDNEFLSVQPEPNWFCGVWPDSQGNYDFLVSMDDSEIVQTGWEVSKMYAKRSALYIYHGYKNLASQGVPTLPDWKVNYDEKEAKCVIDSRSRLSIRKSSIKDNEYLCIASHNGNSQVMHISTTQYEISAAVEMASVCWLGMRAVHSFQAQK
jgi:hypothetical protein